MLDPTIKQLGLPELAKLFGAEPAELQSLCADLLQLKPLHYRPLNRSERDRLILELLTTIGKQDLPAAGKDRQSDWEGGWNENLEKFLASGGQPDALTPAYYKTDVPVRLNGDLVQPLTEHFVRKITHIFRTWLFKKFFEGATTIHEFGCGSGFHLAWLAALFPGKTIYGLDWTEASQRIVAAMREKRGFNVQGAPFDFFTPSRKHRIPKGGAVLTFGALEQVGETFQPFLGYLMAQKPQICVHVECLHELYEENSLLDYLALKYHRRRKYLAGFLTALRGLEEEGRIRIIKVHRQSFGNLYNDSHSYVVWQPGDAGGHEC